jgi:microcystin degradation protein MlrC
VVINDPQAVAALSAIQPGQRMTLAIGGKAGRLGGEPLTLGVVLESTSNGRFELEDRHSHLASMCGVHINMGPCAVVRHAGIRILLTSRKTPPFDLGQLRSQGIVPEEQRVIGVKAAVAHRRAYDKIAKASYTVDTPGPCSSNLKLLPFQRIRRPIYPLDNDT